MNPVQHTVPPAAWRLRPAPRPATAHRAAAIAGTTMITVNNDAPGQQQWRLRHPRLPRPAPLPRDCAQCGQAFIPTYNNGRYCSGACRLRAFRQRRAG